MTQQKEPRKHQDNDLNPCDGFMRSFQEYNSISKFQDAKKRLCWNDVLRGTIHPYILYFCVVWQLYSCPNYLYHKKPFALCIVII